MKILPVQNPSVNVKTVSSKGRVGFDTTLLYKKVGDKWLDTAASGRYKTMEIISTCLSFAERVNNVYLNLSSIMERFGHDCELSYRQSKKTGMYRFFIENKYSNYKVMCGDAELSNKINKVHDIEELESIEESMVKLDPYKENSHFILQRKPEAQQSNFVPDNDYTFLEDKLVGKDKKEATLEDVNRFLEAAKEDGII